MFSKIAAMIFLFSVLAFCQIQKPLQFSVMGDVPRSVVEDTLLQKQIVLHNQKSASEFMLHVGDIKSGSAPCDEAVYAKVTDYLSKLDVPVYMVPGDNEWNDCDDPDLAWRYWIKYFVGFEKRWPGAPIIDRQPQHAANVAWVQNGVLMIGLNLVGGRIFDQIVWDEMLRAGADWASENLGRHKENVRASVVFVQANPKEKHDMFMTDFRAAARDFEKPILFLHGDGHRWLHDDPWLESNIVRVQVDQGGIAPPLQITVTTDVETKFVFEREVF